MSFSPDDYRYMAHALKLARNGLYTTDPNPRVGCVLVRQGQVVGQGWHRRAGEPHAERHALAAASPDAVRGATCYVTLEPCAHTGRTGPCAEALVQAGVAEVVVAMTDPNPRVAGRGLEILRQAGIHVRTGLLEEEARSLNPGFIKRMQSGRPWVRLKVAASVDGRTAMASGESRWITGPQAREDVQRLRARSSAVLTGIGTVLADRPSLTVRPDQWQLSDYGDDWVRQPLRVVLDTRLRTPVDTPLIQQPGDKLIFTCNEDVAAQQPLRDQGAQIRVLPGQGTSLDLQAVLEDLGQRECNELLVECGPVLAGAFMRARQVDELVVYMAPVLLGSSARPLLALPDIDKMADKITLTQLDIRALGQDIRMTFRPEWSD